MVERGKEFLDVALHDKRASVCLFNFSRKCPQPLYGSMGSLSDPCGVRIGNKGRLENSSEVFGYGVMDNAISNFGFVNAPHFGVANEESMICAMPVSLVHKVSMQSKKIIFQMPLKHLHISFIPLADLELVPRGEQTFHRDHRGE